MRKVIAGLIAGVVLGASGTAVAAGSQYWTERGSGYSCEGAGSGVICKGGGYSIGYTSNWVFLQKGKPGGSGPVFGCEKWRSWGTCIGN